MIFSHLWCYFKQYELEKKINIYILTWTCSSNFRLIMIVINFECREEVFTSQNYLNKINYNFSKRALGKAINQVETKNLEPY